MTTKDTLTSKAAAIAHELYAVAEAVETDHPDEKWHTVNKIKSTANDICFYVA